MCVVPCNHSQQVVGKYPMDIYTLPPVECSLCDTMFETRMEMLHHSLALHEKPLPGRVTLVRTPVFHHDLPLHTSLMEREGER